MDAWRIVIIIVLIGVAFGLTLYIIKDLQLRRIYRKHSLALDKAIAKDPRLFMVVESLYKYRHKLGKQEFEAALIAVSTAAYIEMKELENE